MSLLLGLASMTTLVLGATLAHLGVVSSLVGFGVSVASIPLALLSVIGAFVRARKTESRLGYLHCVFGLPALIFFVPPLVEASLSYPRINDVTTDLVDPPAFAQAPRESGLPPAEYAFPEAFVPAVRDSYGWLAPLRVKDSPDRVFLATLELVKSHKDWRMTREDRRGLEIEGVAVSRVFLFKDDFIVRIRKAGDWTMVDMRSRSRDGKGDFGKNAQRIHEFLRLLSERLSRSRAESKSQVANKS